MPPPTSLNIEPEHLEATLTGRETLTGNLSSSGNSLAGIVERNASRVDYNNIVNKPQINSVTLVGNVSAYDLGLANVYYDTTANWNLQPFLVSERKGVYIYSDFEIIYDEVGNPTFVPGIKIGDGTTYVIDLPFITEEMTRMLLDHIGNNTIHLTAAEREFWNNKITCYLDREDLENLVLSKTDYIIEEG